MLHNLIGMRLPVWKWAAALILGEIIHFSILFMWHLGPSMSLDHALVAIEKMDLILIVLLMGIYFYACNRVILKR